MECEVPGLGAVKGLSFAEYSHVEQYRGIPYGSVAARFRRSELVTSWPDGRMDGTAYG
jgi:carboxylesterase type B